MSEKNINNIEEFDLMMKSILDEAREEVPERVWEGVSSGLDKIARRKVVTLWWRRAAVGTAAAAAVAVGAFFTFDNGDEFVQKAAEGDMIAVIEPVATVVEDGHESIDIEDVTLLAAAAEPVKPKQAVAEKAVAPTTASEAIEVSESIEAEADEVAAEPASKPAGKPSEKPAQKKQPVEYFPEDWGEEPSKAKKDISLVLSGVAGTNNALSQNRIGPMRRPEISMAPQKTGVEETSTKSSYGIPISFGAGVKIGLTRRWSIGTGLNYTFLARQFYGKYTSVTPEGTIESVTLSDISNRQHYIGVPVTAFYDVISNDKISFYAYAGGMVEKCVQDSYSLMNTAITHKEKVDGFQLSANAGIGVEFILGRHLGLYIDPSVRYYFSNGQPKSIRTVQPLMLGFEMGLRIDL